MFRTEKCSNRRLIFFVGLCNLTFGILKNLTHVNLAVEGVMRSFSWLKLSVERRCRFENIMMSCSNLVKQNDGEPTTAIQRKELNQLKKMMTDSTTKQNFVTVCEISEQSDSR